MMGDEMEIDDHWQLLFDLEDGYEPGSTDKVDVTFVRDPDSFYVRPKMCKKIVTDLEKVVPTTKTRNFWLYQYVVVKSCRFVRPAKYTRGQIVSINSDNNNTFCSIFAIDYGYIIPSVPSKYIWECRSSVLEYPQLVQECKLANCLPIGNKWSDQSITALREILNAATVTMTVLDRPNAKLIVNMTIDQNNSVSKLMFESGHSVQDPPPPSPPPPPPPSPPLPVIPPLQLPLYVFSFRDFQCG